jgi:RNA-directed DNA polymerase
MESTPVSVSATKQSGADRGRWSWTKPRIWTDRMLTALENGVKGERWFSLIDKVYAERTLEAAASHVTADLKKAAGVDHVTPRQFLRDREEQHP